VFRRTGVSGATRASLLAGASALTSSSFCSWVCVATIGGAGGGATAAKGAAAAGCEVARSACTAGAEGTSVATGATTGGCSGGLEAPPLDDASDSAAEGIFAETGVVEPERATNDGVGVTDIRECGREVRATLLQLPENQRLSAGMRRCAPG
jgi:hypothetical protein